jgi:hypothetical protein
VSAVLGDQVVRADRGEDPEDPAFRWLGHGTMLGAGRAPVLTQVNPGYGALYPARSTAFFIAGTLAFAGS